MSIEPLMEVVSGAILARTVEPRSGEPGADGHTQEANCLNCGTALSGPYCSECGQHGHVHRTVRAFFHDLAHGVLHFEGKVWRTLPLLAWRPGDLTRRYVEGQRARFVSPVALFLFTVFLMFAVVTKLVPTGVMTDPKVQDQMRSEADGSAAQLASLKRDRAAIVARSGSTTKIDAQIAEQTEQVELMQTLAKNGVLKGSAVKVSDDLPVFLRDAAQKAAANPDLLIYKLKSSAYKWSWALIPLSVPFVWLLFPFSRRFRVYDHIVFVTYSLSFMSLLVVALTLISAAGSPGIAVAATVIPPVHMYRQLKGAYALGRVSALLRTLLLGMFAFMVLTLFMLLMVAIGILD